MSYDCSVCGHCIKQTNRYIVGTDTQTEQPIKKQTYFFPSAYSFAFPSHIISTGCIKFNALMQNEKKCRVNKITSALDTCNPALNTLIYDLSKQKHKKMCEIAGTGT